MLTEMLFLENCLFKSAAYNIFLFIHIHGVCSAVFLSLLSPHWLGLNECYWCFQRVYCAQSKNLWVRNNLVFIIRVWLTLRSEEPAPATASTVTGPACLCSVCPARASWAMPFPRIHCIGVLVSWSTLKIRSLWAEERGTVTCTAQTAGWWDDMLWWMIDDTINMTRIYKDILLTFPAFLML